MTAAMTRRRQYLQDPSSWVDLHVSEHDNGWINWRITHHIGGLTSELASGSGPATNMPLVERMYERMYERYYAAKSGSGTDG